MERCLREPELLRRVGDLLALAEHPLGLSQLADDLLRGVTAPLHVESSSAHCDVGRENSHTGWTEPPGSGHPTSTPRGRAADSCSALLPARRSSTAALRAADQLPHTAATALADGQRRWFNLGSASPPRRRACVRDCRRTSAAADSAGDRVPGVIVGVDGDAAHEPLQAPAEKGTGSWSAPMGLARRAAPSVPAASPCSRRRTPTASKVS
jgi:hypothetical protein